MGVGGVNMRIMIRSARMSDARFLWELRTDPVTQVSSFHSEDIPWESHQQWFREKLASQSTRIYIAEDSDDSPIGQVRFERRTPDIAQVSLAVMPAVRGKGYGKAMLAGAVQHVFNELKVNQVDAFVKIDNEPSLRLFAACGFKYQEELVIDDVPSVKLIYRM